MKILKNINQLATLKSVSEKDGRNILPQDLDLIERASVVFNESEILWVGKDGAIPSQYQGMACIDCSQYVVTPEIVDSHTHLIFGGDRSKEYSMRLNGADYQKIAESGGGILNTMEGTNALQKDKLFQKAVERVKRMNTYGIGTIEVKSGYGLNYKKEKEISLSIDRLKKYFAPSIQIKNTFMAAHAIPKEYSSGMEYLEKVVIPLLEELAPKNIIDAVDIFHEKGYFGEEETRKLFTVSKELGIPVKGHFDEFNDNKGAVIAAEFEALSADHLLATTEDGIAALANSSTVATLLPGTGFFLGKPQANARKFLDAGVKVAIASDYNPGSCHCDNVLLVSSLAAPEYKMNLGELWSAITFNSAHALGLKNQGAIIEGNVPRFSFFKTTSLDQVTYSWGQNLADWP